MINSFRGEYSFLSNFYLCEVKFRNNIYKSSEHAYQSEKSEIEVDRAWVASSTTPAIAKRRGGFKGENGKVVTLRPFWDIMRVHFMAGIVLCKFEQHPELLTRLLATGDEELIEGNWWGDMYWGVCNNIGANKLGKILMWVREYLRSAP